MRALAYHRVPGLLAITICLGIVVSFIVPASGDESEPVERVILMKSGRVLTGFASRNAGGWLVEQSNGRVQVPLDQVNVVAKNMTDAYRQQRDSVIQPTPATHVALAQWCISYRLYGEARDELKKCLALDPDHTSARKLLLRLDDMLDPADPKQSVIPHPVRRSNDGFLVPEVESLGGLSPDVATTFTQRIQPLLMNKCGNASCHGSKTSGGSDEGFQLVAMRGAAGGHRMYTERNLAQVLRYIDLEDPALSPILAIPQGNHAGMTPAFHGTGGANQLKMLKVWVKAVVEEKRAEEVELAKRPTLKGKRGTIASLPVTESEAPVDPALPARKSSTIPGLVDNKSLDSFVQRSGTPPNANTSVPAVTQADAAGIDREKTADHARSMEQDPFDPEIFNRRFHSTTRR